MSLISKQLRQSVDRFEAKFIVDERGCWIWMASLCRRSGGYGGFYLDGAKHTAHRAAWILYRGAIPEGMHVLHRCDVPRCVNPDHLFIGTNANNVADMDRKGRRVNAPMRGEKNGRSKLTANAVLEILRGTGTQQEMAKKFGVSRALVGMVRRGDVWRHVRQGGQE